MFWRADKMSTALTDACQFRSRWRKQGGKNHPKTVLEIYLDSKYMLRLELADRGTGGRKDMDTVGVREEDAVDRVR